MAGGQTVWGIDVGKCALKAIKLRALTEGLVEVVGHTLIEHDTVLSDAGGERDAKIAEALEKFLSQNDITSDDIVVSVPGQHTLARFSPLPPVEAKKIPDLVRYEADQQIPFDMDEVIWDYQTFQEEGAPEIQVGIFAMKRELIREYLSHFEAAGIEPVIVQSAPLALYNAALFDGMIGDGTTVLVNIGTENTDLVLANRETLWTRTIPIGGSNFTEALVNAFKLSFSKAENLKKQAATSKYARRIFQAMRPVFADLVQELQRSIGRYTSAHRDAELKKVVGVGDAFKLPVLQKYLQQNLQLDVENPRTFDKMQFAPSAEDPRFKEQLPSFAVAYGLALQGLGLTKIETNLLPPEIARQVVWRKKRPYFGAAAACLLLASGVVWLRHYWDRSALAHRSAGDVRVNSVEQASQIINRPRPTDADPQAWSKEVVSAASFLKQEFSRVSSSGDEEKAKIAEMQRLLENKLVLPRILEVIHECLPTPQEPLASARTPEEYQAAVKQIARSQREQVFIEKLTSVFEPDLRVEEVAAEFVDVSGESDLDEVETQAATKPGFVMRLSCRTPNSLHLRFVNDSFKKNLRTRGRQPDAGFYIDRVALTSIALLAAEAKTPGSPGDLGGPTPTGRSRAAPSPPPSEPQPDTGGEGKYYDPVTGEVIDNDWLFTLAIEVVLADLPEPVAADAGT